MQIIQFLVGASYAALHSFVSYTIPVQVPDLSASVKSAAGAAGTAASSVAAIATSADFLSQLKKLLFRAAGEEGIAENVNGVPPATARHDSTSNVIKYRTEYQTIPCIDTSGQTFAIWLNVFYLTPLTVLIVRFFIRSYLRRTGQRPERATQQSMVP